MIRVKCPQCSGILFLSQFNQTLGRTVCHFCANPVCLQDAELAEPCWRVDLATPVPGTWLGDRGNGVRIIGASTRGPGFVLAGPALLAAGLLAGVLFWMHLSGQGGWGYSVLAAGELLLVAALLPLTAMLGLGQIVVRIAGARSSVFSGVGAIGWRRRFDWSAVGALSEQPSLCRTPQNPRGLCLCLELRSGRSVRLGASLNDVRRYFLFTALCKLIDQRNAGRT